ncbi:RNA polymerase subunit sigma-70 [Comamonas testosteroni TK102]|uniref:Regulator of SigK n=1 Tax=Comamonas testosteroni TK102 TaxID=1392005 RepID=A0A076PTB6_COMTE|nr:MULTISPECIES: anti-sigma factor [Comamonas]AIJ46572.1 RNA polymerase subunit sigma-70 [Comamonas testosteroni TK102]MPS89031.1 RNA polymerase subunit sigma-70 [Comamonas sp.]
MSSETQPQTPPDDLHTQAGEYVLGTLGAGQRRTIEARLPHEPALRAAVDEWEQRLLPLTSIAEPVDPGASLWQRIAASIAPAKRTQAASTKIRWWQWESLALWRGLTGTGFAAAAVLAAVLVLREASPPAAPRYFVVLAAPQSQSPGWLVQAQVEGRLRLVPLGIDNVPAEKSLQFWTKADGWSAPVSLGLVKPGEAIEVPVDKLPPLQPNQLFELTLEPYGGSPIGRPTGPIQFIGRAVQI